MGRLQEAVGLEPDGVLATANRIKGHRRMLEKLIRGACNSIFLRQRTIALTNDIPSPEVIARKLQDIPEIGLYLHIPFCRQICPYCPYNKELYDQETASAYAGALVKEMDS